MENGGGNGAGAGGPQGARARAGAPAPSRGWAWIGAAVATAAILRATLAPSTASSLVGGGFFCPFCGGAGLANLARNVLLFVPLGFFLVLAGVSVRRATLLALALTAGVEFLQQFIPGRNPLLVDLLSNAFGGWVGARVGRGVGGWIAPRPVRRRVLAGVATVAAALGALAPAGLLVPHLEAGSFWSQWNPRIGSGVAYPGPVVEARLGSIPLPAGAVDDDEAVRSAWRGGEVLEVVFLAGSPGDPPGSTGLYRLLSRQNGQPLLSLTVEEGVDLRLVQGTAGGLMGLAGPRPALPGAVAGLAEGEPVTFRARLLPQGTLEVELEGTREDGVHLLPGSTSASGWSLLYVPPGLGEVGQRLLGVLWCAGLLLLTTFWIRSWWGAGLAGGVVLGVLVVSPQLTLHLGALPWEAGVAALVGGVGGVMAGRGLERRWRQVGAALADTPGGARTADAASGQKEAAATPPSSMASEKAPRSP